MTTPADPLRAVGLSTLPLDYGTKFPPLLKGWERYCVEWPTDADIQTWFAGRRNVAVACGPASGGLVVLVFNDRRFAESWFGDGSDSPPRWTWCAESFRGPHIYVRLDGELPPKTLYFNAGDAHPSVLEMRTTGSYVVAPPSKHPKGSDYVWLPHRPDTIAVLGSQPFVEWFERRRSVAAAAGWPLKLGASSTTLAPRGDRPLVGGVGHPVSRVLPEQISEGARNLTLASLAGTLRRRGLGLKELYTAVWIVNQQRCVPPLEDDELKHLAASYAQYNAHSDFLYTDEQALQ